MKRMRFINLMMGGWSDIRFHSSRLFHSHLRGFENLHGRVLEIGSTDSMGLREYLGKTSAQVEYLGVRLEPNFRNLPKILSMNFMDMPLEEGRFDMVISGGVFEPGGIDIAQDTFQRLSRRTANAQRLAKLHGLLSPGGTCVIGTISDPCMFTDHEISEAGFTLPYRMHPFYSFMNHYPQMYSSRDTSELLVMQKPG